MRNFLCASPVLKGTETFKSAVPFALNFVISFTIDDQIYVAFRFTEINDMKESERVYFIFEDSSRAVGFIIVLYLYFQKLKVYGSFWINVKVK